VISIHLLDHYKISFNRLILKMYQNQLLI